VGYNCVVLAKQVPDTQKITGQVMNDDGTVNRGALPAIFNPEDLNALEMALQIKDRFGGRVTVVTMGLPAAAKVLRDALYRGADEAVLVTDPRCAASDTLATSYILSCAVKKIEHDIVLCGRQAIDGDTAQVGPQLAEKLGLTQITYVEALEELDGDVMTVRRNIGNGWQQVDDEVQERPEPGRDRAGRRGDRRSGRRPGAKGPSHQAVEPGRPRSRPEIEQDAGATGDPADALEQKGLLIKQWNLDDVEADLTWCGRNGSPTKVHRIQSVVLAAKESKEIEPTDDGVAAMIHELISDKIIA